MKTVGIIGAGQLAQLLAHNAYQLGLKTLCFSEQPDAPAARNSALYIGNLSCQKDLTKFAEQVDVITIENENIDRSVLQTLSTIKPVYPDEQALVSAQQRITEKTLFQQLDITTPQFIAITTQADIDQLPASFPFPAILKTCRFGYDGKGQVPVKDRSDLAQAWHTLKQTDCILEQRISFECEVSILAARNSFGEIVYYPLIENQHQQGILRQSLCPYNNANLQQMAENVIGRILNNLNYVGLLALELFVVNGQLYANEMAPRVHNSGHVTIESLNCSQFENHLRAICNLPLIRPKIQCDAKMLNVIGDWSILDNLPQQPMHIYNYGKAPRLNRKLGHIILT